MKEIFTFLIITLVSISASAEIIRVDNEYKAYPGNSPLSFKESTLNSLITEWDFGVTSIYGFQLIVELDQDSSLYTGTSKLDVNINYKSYIDSINLNPLTQETLKFSYSGVINALPYGTGTTYGVSFFPDKNAHTKFKIDSAYFLISTEASDVFSNDTPNASYLSSTETGQAVYSVSEPSTLYIILSFILIFGIRKTFY